MTTTTANINNRGCLPSLGFNLKLNPAHGETSESENKSVGVVVVGI